MEFSIGCETYLDGYITSIPVKIDVDKIKKSKINKGIMIKRQIQKQIYPNKALNINEDIDKILITI